MGSDVAGAVIAFVGPDASGKSTLSRALLERFGGERPVSTAHLGGPPDGTWLTRWPRVAVQALRKIPRMVRGERSLAGVAARYPGFQAILDVLTALDRRLLVRRCHRLARGGVVVFTDRYPGRAPGSASGPRLRRRSSVLARALHGVERRIYQALPVPDLVVRLTAPVELTVRRNAERPEPKPEHVIRDSHARGALLRFPGVPEVAVDGTAPLDRTIADAYAAVTAFLERQP